MSNLNPNMIDEDEFDFDDIGNIIAEAKTLKDQMSNETIDPKDILNSIKGTIEDNLEIDTIIEAENYEWKKEINLQKIKDRINKKEGFKTTPSDPLNEAVNEAIKKEEILDQQKMIDILKEDKGLKEQQKQPMQQQQKVDETKEKIQKKRYKPNLINPVDFVNYIEVEYPKIKITAQKEMLMKRKERPKYDEIQSEPLHKLTELIVAKNIQVHCIKTKGDYFIVGDTMGSIFVFSLSQSREEKILYDKELKSVKVNTLEITDDEEFLLSGYSSGLIALWDLKSFKCKKIFTQVHSNSIIATKIFNKDKTAFELFSSDSEGNVNKSIVKNRLVTYSISSISFIMQNKNPVYLIEIMDFPQKEKSANPYLCFFSQTVIICCLSQIKIIILEPDIEEVFSFEKPEDLVEYEVADFGYGLGYAPFINSNTLSTQENNSTLLLLAIAWGKIIYLFNMEVSAGQIKKVFQIGYYINNKTVLRLGFISHSIIILFDSGKYFRAISTRDFTPGSKIIDTNEKIDKSGRLIDSEMKQQKLFQDKKQQWKTTYLNFILIGDNSVYLMGKKTIYNLRLLKWEKCIDNISQDSTKLLIVCSDIYHGRQGALADIPQNEQLRKTAIQTYFEKNIVVRSDLPQSEIEQYMSSIIELCIEIEMFDYLLNRVQNSFENHKDLFLKKLEPFILCDKMLEIPLSQANVDRIIDLYAGNNQIHSLEQLLIHLNINSVSHEDIKVKCREKYLINPYIYICMNNEPKMMFEPITRIYNIFLRKSPSLNFALTSYEELLKDKRLIEIKTSKEYMGYKLFWYIKRCLKGLIFPSEKQMFNEDYNKLILEIEMWLLIEKNFNEFIKFDKVCLFSILKSIFSNEACLKILSDANKRPDRVNIYAPLHSALRPVSDIEPSNLIVLIKHRTIDSDKSAQSFQYLYEFIAKAACYSVVDNALVKEAMSYLFQSDEQQYKAEAEVIEISNDLILLLDKYPLKSNEYYGFIVQSEKSIYVLVKLRLYEKDDNYKRCLELLLDESNIIPNRSKVFFKWVHETLQKLSEGDKTTFSLFKSDVLNNLHKIGALSINHMCEMINKWFSQDSHGLLNKLNQSPEVKLKYVEYLIEYNIKEKDTELLCQNDIDILNMHITLLCELGYHDRILPIVKNNSFYPLHDCLEVTLKHNVNDASIFLYQATGAPIRALILSMVPLDAAYKAIVNNLSSESFSVEIHNDSIAEFFLNKNKCIELCENNGLLHDELWFDFLDKMYLYYKFNKITIHKNSQSVFNEFKANLSMIIKSTLGLMCNYVSIVNIINKVTTNSNAEFKEMKESLVQIISNYTHQLNILGSAKSLLSTCVLKKKEELVKLNCKGHEYELDKCDICQSALFDKKQNREIITFFCGHKIHLNCNRANSPNAPNLCSACSNSELDVMNRTIEINKPIIPQPEEEKKKVLHPLIKKMNMYDKNINERLEMIIEESLKI